MISGQELIDAVKGMTDEELIEFSGIVTIGRGWREREAPRIGGLRGHNLFLDSLSPAQYERWQSNFRR